MTADPTSLDRLHDLVLPAPAPWWPPAPGWLWLLGFAALVALAGLVIWLVRWQQNRYRREALAELAALEAAAAARPVQVLVELSELLKRTALTAYLREQVAALSGPQWFGFLDRAGGTRFSQGLGGALEQALYRAGSADWDPARTADLTGQIRAWIHQHRVPLPAEALGPLPDDASTAGVNLRGAA